MTLPTDEMLEAISHAPLGDDVYREDPTVKKLEEMAAHKMGKEAALLVTSGTQANLDFSDEQYETGRPRVSWRQKSHIYWYEGGGISGVAGLLPWRIKGHLGSNRSRRP